jgi:hypothetical protein
MQREEIGGGNEGAAIPNMTFLEAIKLLWRRYIR